MGTFFIGLNHHSLLYTYQIPQKLTSTQKHVKKLAIGLKKITLDHIPASLGQGNGVQELSR